LKSFRVNQALLLSAFLAVLSPLAAADPAPLLGAKEHRDFNRFSFVVHGDLTGGERPGIFAVAAQQINLLQPDLVINVGDLIEGDGEDAAALHAEWDAYEQRARQIGRPVYLVGGNHDLTSALQREVWRERYGPTYYHFRYRDALFLVLDTEDYTAARRAEITAARDEANAIAAREGWDAFRRTAYAKMTERFAGTIGEAQADYFLDALAQNEDVRWTFLFMHKAPWEDATNAGFARIEEALASRPYTVFHGHEHAQAHVRRHGRDYIRLATTGGVQLPANGRSVDHLTLVNVGETVSAVTLDMAGIRTPAGGLPEGAAGLCFDEAACAEE
jgi:hypothetical protein